MPLMVDALKRGLRRLRRDTRGVAAIEFALIAPVAILLYCGFAELTMAMMAERRAAHAASVVGDLVAQALNGQTTKQEVLNTFSVANAIMSPFPVGSLKLRITSIQADANAVPKMQWTQVSGGYPQMPAGTVSGFPANLLLAGDSVIQADVQYDYTSPLRMTLPNALTYRSTFYLRPRNGVTVACPDC